MTKARIAKVRVRNDGLVRTGLVRVMGLSGKGVSSGLPTSGVRGRTTAASLVCVLLSVALVVGGELCDLSYYASSVGVISLSMVPFFVAFESRRPQAREIVILAVLCALAVSARAAFALVPSFKPTLGIVMIAGFAFGPQAGFLTGSMSALVSNFVFGQGPWTPWQMLAYGICGLVGGVMAKTGLLPQAGWSMGQKIGISLFGFLLTVLFVGPVLDTCSLFVMTSQISPQIAIAVYAAGLPFNVVHGIAVAATLFLAGNPLLRILNRVRVKYGLMEPGGGTVCSNIVDSSPS